MRRRLLFAAAALPLAGAALAYGCSSEPPIESLCLWVADPNNCFREFREDMLTGTNLDCKPQGSPTPINLADPANPNGVSNGSFLMRGMQDICFIGGGGQVVFDPPIDITMFPPALLSVPVTYKMTFMQPDGSECGNATYTSPHGFSITIDGPPDAGPISADAGADDGGDAGDAGVHYTYGTYTSSIAPGRDVFDTTCPSGESHHFDLDEVIGPLGTDSGVPQSACPVFSDLVPNAILTINPGGINVEGAVSFSILYPPVPGSPPGSMASYPPLDSADGSVDLTSPPIAGNLVTYFNCTIPGAPPGCMDGVKDNGETDVDCGGPESSPGCPARCMVAQGCVTDCDCADGLECIVTTGVLQCQIPMSDAGMPITPPARTCTSEVICADGKKDGAETDIDCGGPDCATRCADNKTCLIDSDCVNQFCHNGICATATCTDGVQNEGESDIDCGGALCTACANGKKCTMGSDCINLNCLNGLCSTPSCTDHVQDGSETDVDCGGGCTTKCADLKKCLVNADCANNGCVMGICLEPTCTDGTQDGTESDKDCGGPCPTKCNDGQGCNSNADCVATHVCGLSTPTTNLCFPPTCGNNVVNPPETDADCGGGVCPLCSNGKLCLANSDCLSDGCVSGHCATPTCTDNTKDGTETDVDCGGSCAPAHLCAPGKSCLSNNDCALPLATCMNNVCQ